MAEQKRSIVVVMLAVAVAGFGVANYQVSNLQVDTSAFAAPEAGSAAKAPGDAMASLVPAPHVLAEFPETAQRPIFFANRRVPEKPKPKPVPVVADVKPAVAPASALPPPEPLQLVGIMGGDTGKRALVRTVADPNGIWIAVGDEYRGWHVREIATDNAIVEARGQRSELRLYAAGVSGSVKR